MNWEHEMNWLSWEHVQADWSNVKANLQAHWGKLTDEDLEGIGGKRELLVDRLREIYDLTEVRAEAELRNWERHQTPIEPAT